MAFANPSDSSEILYGASGDVRNELNAHLPTSTAGHYADETELPGGLIIASLRRSTRLINGFLEAAYSAQIPFTASGDVPRMVDEISDDIATFYALRSLSASVGPVSDAKKRDYYDQYVAPPDGILVRIAKGDIQIPELTSQTAEDAKAIRANHAPIFDLDRDTSQGVHPDTLDDIAEERDK